MASMTPLTVQFLHQHKDKVVYEQTIYAGGSIRFENWYGKSYLVFDVPIKNIYKHGFIQRWLKSTRFTRLTRRAMRFISEDGKVLCQLPEERFKVSLNLNTKKYNFWVIEVTLSIDYKPTKLSRLWMANN